MKKLINNFMSNHKIKYMLMTVASFLTIWVISFLVFGGIKKNKNTNNSLGKSQIRNKLLHEDPSQGTINSVFVNTMPNNVSTIYVGGKDLKASDTSTKLGALITSSDKGKTWTLDQYFANPITNGTIKKPIIHKVMTDFYTDKDGTSDMIVVAGEYLKSVPTPSNNKGQGNGYSKCAGQLAYQYVYHSAAGSKINTIVKTNWLDEAVRDFDSSNGQGYSVKINDTSTVISSVLINSWTPTYIQDHIYIISNNHLVNLNDINVIPHNYGPNQYCKGVDRFNAYDFGSVSSDVTKSPGDVKMNHLSSYLNPSSIYGTVIRDSVNITKTTFDPDATSFTFMSGINKSNSIQGNNLCFIVENQHYDAQPPDTKTNPNNSTPYDKPIIIQYDASSPDSTTKGVSYIGVDAQLKDSPIMDNFLVKTITVNPEFKTDDGKYDTNLLILAGEKDNKSYMISPILKLSELNKENIKPPVIHTNPSFAANNDSSYISKVIPVNIFVPPSQSKTVKISIEPLILFGKNMNSSNKNIVFPDNTDIKFIPNSQNLTNQGIMLANIKLTDTTDGGSVTVTSTVFYTVPQNAGTNASSTVSYVDSSLNYDSLVFQSFQSDYTFMTSTLSASNFFEKGGINNYKVTKSTDSNNFNISSTTHNIPHKINKKKNKVVEIVIPLAVIILIILLLPVFFFFLKKKEINIFKNLKQVNIFENLKKINKFKDAKKLNIFKGSNKLSILKDSKKLNIFKFYKNTNIYKNRKMIIKKLSEFKFPGRKKK